VAAIGVAKDGSASGEAVDVRRSVFYGGVGETAEDAAVPTVGMDKDDVGPFGGRGVRLGRGLFLAHVPAGDICHRGCPYCQCAPPQEGAPRVIFCGRFHLFILILAGRIRLTRPEDAIFEGQIIREVVINDQTELAGLLRVGRPPDEGGSGNDE